MQKIVAVPRVHEEFLTDAARSAEIGATVQILDPTMQSKNAYPADFAWNTALAKQFLTDLQADTGALAKDKKNTALDMLNYQYSLAPQLGRDERAALELFAGKSSDKSPREIEEGEMRELGQRMLLIACHNELLYLELCKINERFSVQQEKLKALLDENEHVTQAFYRSEDMLVNWKQVLPAFVFFCRDADAFFITDKGMAEEIALLAERTEQKNGLMVCTLTKERLAQLLPERFKAFCTKEEYCFLAEKGE